MANIEENKLALAKLIQNQSSSNVKEYNKVFRQMAQQLILVAGIFLALSTQVSVKLSASSNIVKVLSVCTVIFLSFSILFGILQHLMEAAFFRKLALTKFDLIEDIATNNEDSYDKFLGKKEQLGKMTGRSTPRWPTFVQIALLATSVALISTISLLQLIDN